MKRKEIRVLVTGGGTGGHIYPALAIAKGIKEDIPNSKFLYIGTDRGLEKDLVPKAGFAFKSITAEGLERKVSWSALRAGLKTLKGGLEALRLIRKFKPHVVIGTGGYVCGPVIMAASLLKVPALIHEQNAYPGITNKLLASHVQKICLTFVEAAKYFKTKATIIDTGLPVRSEILNATREAGLSSLNLSDKINILVVGGSQGAKKINEIMLEMYQELASNDKINLVHVTGKSDYERVAAQAKAKGVNLASQGNIKIRPYIYEMENALAAADIVIGRSGASFLAEVMVRGIPAILIPYPFAAENHQEYNARVLEKHQAAYVLLEKELDKKLLEDKLKELIASREKREQMAKASLALGKKDALANIVKEVIDLI